MLHIQPELACASAVHPAEIITAEGGVMSRDTRLEVARNLARIYADVLGEPLPAPLLELLKRLEAQEASRRSE
jgi:hypothetical protein